MKKKIKRNLGPMFASLTSAVSCCFLIYNQSAPHIVIEASSFSSYCFLKNTVYILL